jgi:hypothetical protein
MADDESTFFLPDGITDDAPVSPGRHSPLHGDRLARRDMMLPDSHAHHHHDMYGGPATIAGPFGAAPGMPAACLR